jgi:hypothetical protein
MGYQITGYKIFILQSDLLTYQIDYSYCDGTQDSIRIAASCSIPVTHLHTSYYNLPWGSSITAKVIASNIYGDSVIS